jgi:hypothetical protein
MSVFEFHCSEAFPTGNSLITSWDQPFLLAIFGSKAIQNLLKGIFSDKFFS